MNFLINVLHGFFIDIINDYFDLVIRYSFLLDIFLYKLASFVRRMVININNMVILIILHKDRVKIPKIKSPFHIIVGRYNNTESKLIILISIDMIMFFIKFSFHLHDSFYCLYFSCLILIKWRHFYFNSTIIINIMY